MKPNHRQYINESDSNFIKNAIKNTVDALFRSDKAQTDSKINPGTSVTVVARLDEFTVDDGTELDHIASAGQVNINDLTIVAAGRFEKTASEGAHC